MPIDLKPMKLYLKLAWRNIWRNKFRTWITAAAVSLAVFLSCVMQSMQLGSYERMIDNSVRFYTGHMELHHIDYWDEKILDNSFPEAYLDQVDLTSDELEVIVPRLTSFALASYIDKTRGVIVNGIDPQREAELTNLDEKVTAGSYLDRGGALLGQDLAEYLKISVGDTVVLISQGYHGVNAAAKYPVSGILRIPVPELSQSAVYLSLKDAQFFYGAEGMITSTSLLLKNQKRMEAVQATLSEELGSFELELMNWQEMMPELLQGIELDYYGGLIMIYILYAVIGFAILGTLLMMVKERTYEFGILSSLGMKRMKIQIMVGFEILMLTFLGVFMGLIVSFPIVLYYYFNPIRFSGEAAAAFESFGYEPIMPFSMDPVIFYHQGIVILIISLFLGIYPMIAIYQLRIIKALKE